MGPSATRPIPTSETGIVKSITNGRRNDLNCVAMIMKTTITASPSATPSPPNVVRMRSTCPTNDVFTFVSTYNDGTNPSNQQQQVVATISIP